MMSMIVGAKVIGTLETVLAFEVAFTLRRATTETETGNGNNRKEENFWQVANACGNSHNFVFSWIPIHM